MVEDLNKKAREIIEQNQYLTLATVDKENGTWVSILCYVFDTDWNLYFASIPSSRHCQNLELDRRVTFTIYDSRQGWGMGIGLQMEGEAEKVGGGEGIKAETTYFKRKFPFGSVGGAFAEGFKKLLNDKTYTFYRIIPTKVWINNPNAEHDERVEVFLK